MCALAGRLVLVVDRGIRSHLERMVGMFAIAEVDRAAIGVDPETRGPLREWADALLEPSRISRKGFLHAAPLARAWRGRSAGRVDRLQMLWGVSTLQTWLGAQRRADPTAAREAA